MSAPEAKKAAKPTVREILDGSATPSYVVHPLAPSPDDPGRCGTVVLVPSGVAYYFALVYVAGDEGNLTVALPPVQGIVVMDLPDGFVTSKGVINTAIIDGTGGGPPGIVGPS